MERCDFLPVSAEEMHERGWWWYDALVVGGDAYVDHPSFGTAVISPISKPTLNTMTDSSIRM